MRAKKVSPPAPPYTCFAAVRKSDGKEYIDLQTVTSCREAVRLRVKTTNDLIPQWATANPVQRIVLCTISEVIDDGE